MNRSEITQWSLIGAAVTAIPLINPDSGAATTVYLIAAGGLAFELAAAAWIRHDKSTPA
ncbi:MULTISPECIES: hypothetical protein [unclassified Streptomyces]|uniref:hypothetical protein n=1 Tax=unclassified Streptomyces TaxID=2593676 RepID=UPI0033EB9AA3